MSTAGKQIAQTELEALADIELACGEFMRAYGSRAEGRRYATLKEEAAMVGLMEALRRVHVLRATLSRV